MASRLSSLSSVSSVSTIERQTVNSEGLLHTAAATVSPNEPEQPRLDHGAAIDQVNSTLNLGPHDQRNDLSQYDKVVPDSEMKDFVEIHQTKYNKNSWYHDWWFWEILGALLSLGSTAAIIVILAVYNHQPVPALRYGITLNAMLSVLSTTAKTSMLLAVTESISQAKWLLFRKEGRSLADFNTIDGASRGPRGAFQLLYRFRDGRTVLASAGALIILASLAVDPFTQQILSYSSVSRVTSSHEQPNVPRVSSWNSSGDASSMESEDRDRVSALPLAFEASIQDSLLSLGAANSTLNINCPTGNCTFDRSDTLGFCSTCSDVTAEVNMTCTRRPGNDPNGDLHCIYYLPGDVNIQAHDRRIPDAQHHRFFRITTHMSVVAWRRYEALLGNVPSMIGGSGALNHTSLSPGTTVFQSVGDPILGFGRVIFNGSNNSVSAIGSQVMPRATECTLYWCVQTLDTSIQNGILNQTLVGSWSNSPALDTAAVYLAPNFTSNAGGKSRAGGYYVSPMSNLPLVRYLQGVFNATVRGNTTVKGTNPPGLGFPEQELTEPILSYTSGLAQALWYADDLDSFMSNLADRMTDTLRNLYSDPEPDTTTTETYVLVTWPWLALPVGLVLSSCMVLVAIITSSSRYQTMVWKSSSLAVLLHGLGGGGERSGFLVYKKQMEKEAEDMKVQLAENTSGDLRLVVL